MTGSILQFMITISNFRDVTPIRFLMEKIDFILKTILIIVIIITMIIGVNLLLLFLYSVNIYIHPHTKRGQLKSVKKRLIN